MPEELNPIASRISLGDGQSWIKKDINYITPLMTIMYKVIDKMLLEKNDVPQALMVGWIKEIGKEEGIEVSERIAEAMFTIIKPVGHNPRKRKG